MQRRIVLLIVLLAALALSAACTQLSPTAAPLPPTKTPKPTFTPSPAWTATPVVFPTETPIPATATPEPTATPETPPTATPDPVVRLTANQNINVRSGPGTNYPQIGTIGAGDTYEVEAQNPEGSWVQFNLNGQGAWVAANLVSLSGSLETVEIAQNIPAPPAPTARPTARPTAVPPPPTAPPPPPAPTYPFMLLKGVERCEPNAGVSYYDGFVRYKSNALRNGVCVHTAFYGPRVTKCSGCDGVGDGFWSFSPFGGPAPAGVTVEVYVVQCPGPLPLGGVTLDTPGGFSGSDLTPLSEKWVHTFNQSEQCTGITFVGD